MLLEEDSFLGDRLCRKEPGRHAFYRSQWLDGMSELRLLRSFSRQSRKWGYLELANASATHFSSGPKLVAQAATEADQEHGPRRKIPCKIATDVRITLDSGVRTMAENMIRCSSD